MLTIDAHKAQPALKDEPVPSVTLRISKSFPDNLDIFKTSQLHRRNAKRIMRALKVLPQGTLHHLLIELLKEKETFLILR